MSEVSTTAAETVDLAEPVVEEVSGKKELVHTPLVSVDMWTDAASTFIPTLRKDMTPEQRVEAVRDTMKKVIHVDDKLNLMAGELLYEIQKNEYWKTFTFQDPESKEFRNFKTFDEYIESELEYQRRKAYYLIQIYKKFVVDLALPQETLRDLEWSKAKELIPVIDPSNWTDLIAKSKNMTVKQVQAMVKEYIDAKKKIEAEAGGTPATSEKEATVKMGFVLAPEQAENVQKALEAAQRMTGSDKTGNLLDLICTDFMGSVLGEGSLDDLLGKLDIIKNSVERSFGVTLEIKSVDTKTIPALGTAKA